MTRHLTVTLATVLLAAGLGLAWISKTNTDLPVLAQAPPQAEFELAAKRGQAPYDARLLAVESLGLELLSLGLVLGLIAPELTSGKFATLAAGTLACVVFSPLAPLPLPVTSGLAALTNSLSPSDPSQALSFSRCLATLLPWGYAGVVWLAIVSIPAATLSLSPVDAEKQKGPPVDPHRILSLLALVTVAALLALAAYSASPEAGRQLCFVAVMFNAAILIARPRRPILSALWFLAVLVPLLDPIPDRSSAQTGPPIDSPTTADIRRKVAAGELFNTPALRSVLPDSIRPPFEIAANPSPAPAFIPNSAPPLPGLDDLPYWSNRSQTGEPPDASGDFTSTPFATKTGIIQVRIAGSLHPPDTDLLLKSAGGHTYHSLIPTVAATTRWRRINFEVPPGEYRIIATAHSPSQWLAFTAPSEIHVGPRFANKLIQSWAWWLTAGGLLAAALAAVVRWPRLNSLSLFSRASSLPPASSSTPSSIAPSPPPSTSPAPIAPIDTRIWPTLLRAAPWLSLVAYLLLLSHHLDTTAGPNDSGGYLNSAKLLAAHHTTSLPRPVLSGAPATDLSPYLPGTFVATPDGRLAPTYPVGFPLIIAAVAQLMPLAAAVPLVILLQACLGVALTYNLAREFELSAGWAWLAAAIVGLSPVYLFQALQPQSDGPALVWVTAAIYLAWTSARHPWRALLAGVATAMAVLIRPSNALCMIPLAICFWAQWRHLALWILGGIPGAVFQFWYNHRLYGHGLSTGYGDPNEVSSGFGLRFAPLTGHAYLHWLPAFFTPLVFLSLIGPWLPNHARRARLMLAAWAAAFLLFYTFYWCTYDNWYNMRFVLPAVPAMLILGLWTMQWLCALRPVPVLLRVAAALVLLALLVHRSAEERIFYWMRANRVNADAALWARDHLPRNAVVLGKHITGPLFYYSDLALLRTDSAPAHSPDFYAALAQSHRPVYALTFHWERAGFQWGKGKGDGYPDAPGPWEHLATLGDNEVHAWIRR